MTSVLKDLASKHTLCLLAASAILISCASSSPKRALFSDPGQFESLASNAVEAPKAVVVAAPVEPEKPAPVTPAPESRAVAFDGTSLISPPLPNPFTTPNRTISSVAPPSVAPLPPADVISPEGAFTSLVRGNERFVTGAVVGEHRDEARRRALASTQHPHSIVLASSDSRVPPELIFDQGLGDLLTIRVGGNVLGSAQVASIEDAIEHLGSKLVVVLGHESSDVVKAALGDQEAKGERSLDQDWLVSSVRSNIASRKLASVSSPVVDPKFRAAAVANVDAVTEQLLTRSKIVSRAISEGRVKIVRGIYGIENGKVDFWGMK